MELIVGRIKFKQFSRAGRIKLRVVGPKAEAKGKGEDKTVEVIALLNSGYEAPTPQLLIPASSAYDLGLWLPTNTVDVELDTANSLPEEVALPKDSIVEGFSRRR